MAGWPASREDRGFGVCGAVLLAGGGEPTLPWESASSWLWGPLSWLGGSRQQVWDPAVSESALRRFFPHRLWSRSVTPRCCRVEQRSSCSSTSFSSRRSMRVSRERSPFSSSFSWLSSHLSWDPHLSKAEPWEVGARQDKCSDSSCCLVAPRREPVHTGPWSVGGPFVALVLFLAGRAVRGPGRPLSYRMASPVVKVNGPCRARLCRWSSPSTSLWLRKHKTELGNQCTNEKGGPGQKAAVAEQPNRWTRGRVSSVPVFTPKEAALTLNLLLSCIFWSIVLDSETHVVSEETAHFWNEYSRNPCRIP